MRPDPFKVEMVNVYTNPDALEQAFLDSVRDMRRAIIFTSTRLRSLKMQIRELEQKPLFDGSIWMKDGKYPYKVFYDDCGERKRKYVGLTGLENLQQSIANYKELQRLHSEFNQLYDRFMRSMAILKHHQTELVVEQQSLFGDSNQLPAGRA